MCRMFYPARVPPSGPLHRFSSPARQKNLPASGTTLFTLRRKSRRRAHLRTRRLHALPRALPARLVGGARWMTPPPLSKHFCFPFFERTCHAAALLAPPLPALPDSICVLCRKEAPGRRALCKSCEQKLGPAPPPLTAGSLVVTAACEYQPPISRLMLQYKYENRRSLCRLFARLMAERCEIPPNFCIAALPLHSKRIQERGYSQTDLLARSLCSQTGLPAFSGRAPSPARHRPPDRSDREERQRNVKDAFFASGAEGSHVLLVDDVMTTGATLRACARALYEGGAASVQAAVVCYARSESSEQAGKRLVESPD